MAEKVTDMKLKVDLECKKCYKKVKKLLSKYPQIRDEKFDEKENIVTITVVCCSPEKIRDKLCCKGGGSIKSIEIVEPTKPKPKPKPAEDDKKKESEKPKPKPAETEKKKDADKPKPTEAEKKKEADKPKSDPPKPKEKTVPPPDPVPKLPGPVPAYPPVPPPTAVPVGICCVPCTEGRPGGPCYNDYGWPVLCYDGYYARPVYDSYGGGRPYYVSRCDQYFSEENATGCTIM